MFQRKNFIRQSRAFGSALDSTPRARAVDERARRWMARSRSLAAPIDVDRDRARATASVASRRPRATRPREKNTSDPSLVFRRRARVPRRPDRPRETRDASDPRDDDGDDIARAHLLASAFFAARASTATVGFCAEARMVNIVCCRSCACECPVAVAADARESRRARGEGLDDESQSEKIYRRIGSDSDLYRWGVKGHIKWVRRV